MRNMKTNILFNNIANLSKIVFVHILPLLVLFDSIHENIVNAQTGIITTVSGGGKLSNVDVDGVPATEVAFRSFELFDVFVDESGNIFIAGNSVFKVDGLTGIITTVANIAAFSVFVDKSGNIFIAEPDSIRKVDGETGIITTVAGNANIEFSVDGVPATESRIEPIDIFVDNSGSIFFF